MVCSQSDAFILFKNPKLPRTGSGSSDIGHIMKERLAEMQQLWPFLILAHTKQVRSSVELNFFSPSPVFPDQASLLSAWYTDDPMVGARSTISYGIPCCVF